ncbi:MAG: type I-C CRISPR-associated endonuclease Cas1 [Candidatus Hydrogenedentes bacterium]|nr:type I-C CRISPR-associated endonuclease Cas1 [Candidatus Hydrogenedentota bacterium]
MKHLLNTLYVTTQGAYLHQEGETVMVRVENEVKLKLPIHTLGGIVCFGLVTCSPPLLGLCAERGVTVSFLSEHGKFRASIHGPVSGNVLLRRAQYRYADSMEHSARFARNMVIAKMANCRTVALRAARETDQTEVSQRLRDAASILAGKIRTLRHPAPLNVVRGQEGEAAKYYFAVFDDLICAQKEDFQFQKRTRRPPLNKVNTLLSFVYTLLTHDMRSALESVGLDPAVGYLHRDRPGRPSLALDMIEELRPAIADRLVLSLINRRQVQPKGFIISETGAVTMSDDTRKEVLVAWQKRKQEEIEHPFLKEKIQIGLLPHVQALLLARTLRGDLDQYPPFFWR